MYFQSRHPEQKISLKFSCHHLKKHELNFIKNRRRVTEYRDLQTFIQIKRKRSNNLSPEVIGETEIKLYDFNPEYERMIKIPYRFEEDGDLILELIN